MKLVGFFLNEISYNLALYFISIMGCFFYFHFFTINVHGRIPDCDVEFAFEKADRDCAGHEYDFCHWRDSSFSSLEFSTVAWADGSLPIALVSFGNWASSIFGLMPTCADCAKPGVATFFT